MMFVERVPDPTEIMESTWERTEAKYCIDADKGIWKCCNCEYTGPGEHFIFPGPDGCCPPVCEDCYEVCL